jgi:hypothetical protein
MIIQKSFSYLLDWAGRPRIIRAPPLDTLSDPKGRLSSLVQHLLIVALGTKNVLVLIQKKLSPSGRR